jgi:outer membrane lipoprotein-sorting protein
VIAVIGIPRLQGEGSDADVAGLAASVAAAAAGADSRVELVGKETLDGAPVYHLKVTKKGGPPQDYYLDAETGLEKKISVAGRSPDGSQTVNVTEFSDYRSVDGSLVPFVMKQRQNGTVVATTTLDKVEFNVDVDDDYFKMPAK